MKYKLEDLIELKTQGVNTTTDNIEYVSQGYKIVQAKNIQPYNITFDEKNYVSEKIYSKIKENHKLHKGDVLYTNIGSQLGNSAIYNSDEKAIITWNVMKLIPKKQIITNDFLCYLLNYHKTEIVSLNSSSTMPFVSGKELMNFKIEVPSILIQHKITKVLKTIENKIKLNTKTNDNLLELIKKLYIEKIKNNNDINFEEKNLDEFCNIFTGKKNANASEENGQYKFFTCAPEPLSINSYIYDGPAVIVAGNGAYTGRTNFYNGKFDLYQRTYGITTNNDYIYLFYAMIYTDLQNDIMGGTHGSAIPYIVMNDIAKFKVKYNKELFDELSQKIKVLLLKIKSNESQNETLEQLRDTLLPKLMNGKIDLNTINI